MVITEASNTDVLSQATRAVGMKGTPAPDFGSPEDLLTPIPYIIPAQLFAAFLAEQKGFNPDQPRTLSKVTKTI
jgi:glucosamine--fructose-6-phosphate aminotransferase (isomerizing)